MEQAPVHDSVTTKLILLLPGIWNYSREYEYIIVRLRYNNIFTIVQIL